MCGAFAQTTSGLQPQKRGSRAGGRAEFTHAKRKHRRSRREHRQSSLRIMDDNRRVIHASLDARHGGAQNDRSPVIKPKLYVQQPRMPNVITLIPESQPLRSPGEPQAQGLPIPDPQNLQRATSPATTPPRRSADETTQRPRKYAASSRLGRARRDRAEMRESSAPPPQAKSRASKSCHALLLPAARRKSVRRRARLPQTGEPVLAAEVGFQERGSREQASERLVFPLRPARVRDCDPKVGDA